MKNKILILFVFGWMGACARSTPTTPPTPLQTRPPIQDLTPVQTTTPPAMDVSSSTTPELIDAALTRGEITADQRLLYLAYAIYEYDSLPEAYRSQKRWDGSLILRELKKSASTPAVVCNMDQEARVEFQRLLKVSVECTP